MALSKDEIENIRQESKKVENHKEKSIEKPKKGKKMLWISLSSLIVILIMGGFGYSFVQSNKPGPLDDFAKCLTEKGAIMYGASFCKYTHGQKGMFGNSAKYLDYRDFSEDANIKFTPTWVIDGQYYKNAQSLDRLAFITGCVIG